jgi:TRAP-type mannitol/chloroaromatic compound transport system permease large subunit
MAPFYLKGVAPKHVTIEQIFAGVMPFLGIVVVCLLILYVFPEVALWLPDAVYN